MGRKNWNKVAKAQFDDLSVYYQDDWRDLRNRVM